LIWRAAPPTTFTPPTPGIDSKRVATTSSAMSVSSRTGRSALCSAIDMIGESFGSKRWMIGSSMSCGSCRRMRATLPCTSCSASIGFAESSSRTRTFELPSDDVEVTSRIPWTVLTASSIGLESSRSTTSGDAPGYDVWMLTTGG
jgi:hypothetical protein